MEEKPGRSGYSLSRVGTVGDSVRYLRPTGSLPETGVRVAVGVKRAVCMRVSGSQR